MRADGRPAGSLAPTQRRGLVWLQRFLFIVGQFIDVFVCFATFPTVLPFHFLFHLRHGLERQERLSSSGDEMRARQITLR